MTASQLGYTRTGGSWKLFQSLPHNGLHGGGENKLDTSFEEGSNGPYPPRLVAQEISAVTDTAHQ